MRFMLLRQHRRNISLSHFLIEVNASVSRELRAHHVRGDNVFYAAAAAAEFWRGPCVPDTGSGLRNDLGTEPLVEIREGMSSRHSGPFLRALASGALRHAATWSAF